MPKASRKQPLKKRSCPICYREFHPSAFTAHFKKCERDKRIADGAREYEREMTKRRFERLAVPGGSVNETEDTSEDNVAVGSSELQSLQEIEVPHLNAASPTNVAEATPPAKETNGATMDEIRTEYHPSSHKQAKVYRSEGFDSESAHRQRPDVTEPWWPTFNSQEDFLFAELVHEARLSSELVDRLLELIHRCIDGEGVLTFKDHADVEAARNRASESPTESVTAVNTA